MARIVVILAILALCGAATATAAESGSYDNPVLGSTPCVVLTEYSVHPEAPAGERAGFRASATFRNLCARAVDLALCLVFVTPVEDADRSCFGGLIRPGGLTQVSDVNVPVMVARPELQWRYVP